MFGTSVKEKGIINTFFLSVKFVLLKITGFRLLDGLFYDRSLEENIYEIRPKKKVVIRQAKENDLEKLYSLVDYKKYSVFKKRFSENKVCFVILNGEIVVGYAWLSVTNEYESNCRIEVRLQDREAYLFDDYVVPEYRHNGLQIALINTRLIYLKSRGYKTAIAIVFDKNTHSRKAYVSAGFQAHKSVILLSLFGCNLHHWQSILGSR
jgi:GNAT superfamily N-acetyltransferase